VSASEPQPWPPLLRALDQDGTGWSARTIAVSAGRPKGAGATLNQPLVLASNFRDGGDYARTHGTDSWTAFEDAIGALEGGHALSFASGAVASAILHALMPKVIVLPNASYMGVRTLIAEVAAGHGIEVRLVDVTNADEVLRASQGADVVWLESPTNPTLDVADLAMLCASLAARSVPTVIDSTFATPLGQQPLALGATIVLHSATKFIGGHSDLLLGVAVTRDVNIHEALFRARTYVGATPGALETFLALRGLRTLPLRYEASTTSAVELAKRLRAHPGISSVRQIGPMMAVIVSGGAAVGDWVCDNVRLAVPATSLGGVETTLERRQKYAGDAHIDPGLLRVSVGIEDVEDLWTDLSEALDSAPML
jgi:cystathionine gamma-synthase